MADQGTGIAGHAGGTSGKTLDECKAFCDETAGCNSIAWRSAGDCWLKEKCLTLEEPSNTGNVNGFKSYYKPCTGMLMLIHYYYYQRRKNIYIQDVSVVKNNLYCANSS